MFHSSEDQVALIDELSSDNESVTVTPGSVEELLSNVKPLLSEKLVERVGACFQFDICSENGQYRQCYLDLSQGKMKKVKEKKIRNLKAQFVRVYRISVYLVCCLAIDVATSALDIKTFC